jgi:hypothetical protein
MKSVRLPAIIFALTLVIATVPTAASADDAQLMAQQSCTSNPSITCCQNYSVSGCAAIISARETELDALEATRLSKVETHRLTSKADAETVYGAIGKTNKDGNTAPTAAEVTQAALFATNAQTRHDQILADTQTALATDHTAFKSTYSSITGATERARIHAQNRAILDANDKLATKLQIQDKKIFLNKLSNQ